MWGHLEPQCTGPFSQLKISWSTSSLAFVSPQTPRTRTPRMRTLMSWSHTSLLLFQILFQQVHSSHAQHVSGVGALLWGWEAEVHLGGTSATLPPTWHKVQESSIGRGSLGGTPTYLGKFLLGCFFMGSQGSETLGASCPPPSTLSRSLCLSCLPKGSCDLDTRFPPAISAILAAPLLSSGLGVLE